MHEIVVRQSYPLSYVHAKRSFDIAVAFTLLVLLSPLFLLTALLILIEDGRPIFYSQTRIGKHRKQFRFWKFRSMRKTSDKERGVLFAQSGQLRFKMKNDPRKTFIGQFIRKLSIDELPQLWNVVKGDMSLVGPRPALPEEVIHYNAYQMQRLNVDQGITCIWQIKGRSLIPFEEQVELDLEYINQRNFIFDLKLLILTIPAVLTGRGAY